MKRLPFFVCALVAVVLSTCSPQRTHDVDFYYWKSRCEIGEIEREYFGQLESKRLFVRLFDVDVEGGVAVPVGQIQGFGKEQLPSCDVEVVPVVFITNETFLANADNEAITRLATNVINGVAHFMGDAGLDFGEIQIDCDWTERTRSAYFRFLTNLAELSQRSVSCTLRLHQIHDRERTGVPPVKRGSLMCYATSNPQKGMTRNSILDMELLKAYTTNINDYPLDFDVILPIYSWGIVTNHFGQVKLVNGLTAADLETPMFEKQDDNLYLVKEEGFLQGLYVNAGFTVKIETITPELLAEAKQYLDRQIDRDFCWVYFHLSRGFLSRFAIDELK
ncbi:MAG: hypothetical protein IJ057_02855 [Bacteroidales bacterium]|nr:hypothetical protein [Bacteroidales bacterium]